MTDDTKRETKRADQLHPGDVIVEDGYEPDDDGKMQHFDVYRRVLVAEPVEDETGRVLVVYAGAHTDNVRCTEEFALATADEYRAYEKTAREQRKRTRIRAGLERLLELVDSGLPLPSFVRVELPLMPDAESVRAWADLLDVPAVDADNAGRPTTDATTDLAADPDGRQLVEFRVWHLGPKAVES